MKILFQQIEFTTNGKMILKSEEANSFFCSSKNGKVKEVYDREHKMRWTSEFNKDYLYLSARIICKDLSTIKSLTVYYSSE